MLSDSVGQEEISALQKHCDQLASFEGIRLVFLIHETGQIIVSSGDVRKEDLTSLAALFAGSMASAIEVSKIFKEPQFASMVFEGPEEQVLMTSVKPKSLLIVHFEKTRALGWVRFQIKKQHNTLASHLASLKQKFDQIKSPMCDVSEEEIDNLDFGGF